jgi:ATP-dependent Clp protease ATP-binding subunit ClpA
LQKKDKMPTFSRSLEQSLHRALALANERHHEYATLEHLLLALLDDQDAAAVMRACNVDLDKLRRSLTSYLESELENLSAKATRIPSRRPGSSASFSAP